MNDRAASLAGHLRPHRAAVRLSIRSADCASRVRRNANQLQVQSGLLDGGLRRPRRTIANTDSRRPVLSNTYRAWRLCVPCSAIPAAVTLELDGRAVALPCGPSSRLLRFWLDASEHMSRVQAAPRRPAVRSAPPAPAAMWESSDVSRAAAACIPVCCLRLPINYRPAGLSSWRRPGLGIRCCLKHLCANGIWRCEGVWSGAARLRTIDVPHESLAVQRPNAWCYGVLSNPGLMNHANSTRMCGGRRRAWTRHGVCSSLP